MGLDEKWTRTVDDGLTNKAWDDYDDTIKAEFDDYNARFALTPGFKKIDWKIGKAMVWVESGGPSEDAWNKRVLQIGNKGDPAFDVLVGGRENSKLIVSIPLAGLLAKHIGEPKVNIRAGLAYLVTRMAKFEVKSIEDEKDKKEYAHTVASGESLDTIAKRVGTTVEVLLAMNPKAKKMIHPKDVLKYKKAAMTTVIAGWREFTTITVADRYNGGGDPNYSAKLDYVIKLFPRLKR